MIEHVSCAKKPKIESGNTSAMSRPNPFDALVHLPPPVRMIVLPLLDMDTGRPVSWSVLFRGSMHIGITRAEIAGHAQSLRDDTNAQTFRARMRVALDR